LPLNIAEALAQGLELLRPLAGENAFNPAVPAALLRAGLQRLPVPLKDGGLGGGLVDAMRVLAELGSVDGSAALGLAMHYQTLGAAMESVGCVCVPPRISVVRTAYPTVWL